MSNEKVKEIDCRPRNIYEDRVKELEQLVSNVYNDIYHRTKLAVINGDRETFTIDIHPSLWEEMGLVKINMLSKQKK